MKVTVILANLFWIPNPFLLQVTKKIKKILNSIMIISWRKEGICNKYSRHLKCLQNVVKLKSVKSCTKFQNSIGFLGQYFQNLEWFLYRNKQSQYIEVLQEGVSSRAIHNWLWTYIFLSKKKFKRYSNFLYVYKNIFCNFLVQTLQYFFLI